MRRPALSALVGLLLAVPAYAQTTLRPGAAGLNVEAVAPGEQRFTVRLVEPAVQDIGTLHSRLSVSDGVATLVTRVSIPITQQQSIDSLRATWPNLEPISHHSTARLIREVVFDPETAFLSERLPDGPAEATETRMEPGGFFDLSWLSVIVQAIPHAEGYAAGVVGFEPERAAAATSPLTVTGRETRQTPAGPREAWTVDAERGGQTTTYFVDVETRELLGLRRRPQRGVVFEAVLTGE